jgi:hypothetical protein
MATKASYSLVVFGFSMALCIGWWNELYNAITLTGEDSVDVLSSALADSNIPAELEPSEIYLTLNGGENQASMLRTGYSWVSPIQPSTELEGDLYSHWSSISFNEPPHEIMADWVGQFEVPGQLLNALKNINRFKSKVTVLIVEGQELSDEHLAEIAKIATLRVLIVDSSTLENQVLDKHLGVRKDVTVFHSQRLWIDQFTDFSAQGGGTVILRKHQCASLPAIVDDIYRLQITEISRQGTHFFVKGMPVPSDKLDLLHCISTLRYLDLSGSEISDEQLSGLSVLDELQILRLSNTKLTGRSLKDLRLDTILKLDVSQLQLETGLPTLPNLEVMIARDVVAESLFDAASMPKLRSLDVYGTVMSASDLEALETFEALKHLVIGNRYRGHAAIDKLIERKVRVEFF